MQWIRLAALAALATITAAAQQQGSAAGAIFRKVWDQTSSTGTSANLPNVGQTMHLLHVIFPAAVAPVSNIQVRVEASYDGSTWFPIGQDITSAPRLGGITYQVSVAYAPFPFLRVRSLLAPPSPMTVYYNGQRRAVTAYIDEELDRFIL